MVFTIEELPYEKALIAYQASSFFTSFVAFFDFLNSWAVIKIDEEEDTLDIFRYDYQAAMATDQELGQGVEDLELVLGYLGKIIARS